MEDDDIPDTRVFVSGLPPHYTSEQLGAHFAGRYQITDSVVIPNRRIGFVGFRNYTLAKNAVKYFDKSYIRMSKISVEIAKPVDFHRELNTNADPAPQDAHKPQGDQKPLVDTTSNSAKSAFTSYESLITKTSHKRKRAEAEDQGEEMKDYMGVMQPKSKSTRANGELMPKHETPEGKNAGDIVQEDKIAKEKKRKKSKKGENEPEVDAAETSEAGRKLKKKERKEKKRLLEDNGQKPDEEIVVEDKEARRKRKTEKKLKKLNAESNAEGGVEPLNDDAAAGIDDTETDTAQPDIPRSDNDWLRGKTSRLLDLIGPDEQMMEREDLRRNEVLEPAEFSNNNEDMDFDTEPNPAAPNLASAAINDPSAKMAAVLNGRLFVRNLPFSTTESDLESTFSKYGSIVEVHVSKDFKSSSSKGMAFVQFAEPDAAESALHALDGKTFQGRLLHILPASDKKVDQLDDFTFAKLPLKKQKAIKQKKEASNATFSWNSLYMNPDAVLASVADRLGVSKSEVLDPASSDAAVKQALAETNTIKDTKNYLQNNGVNIEAFKTVRRDHRTILLKNFSFGTTSDELRSLLEPFGSISRLILPPTGTIAVAQYEDAHMAAKAMKHLAYRNLKGSVLFLEKAPAGIFDVSENARKLQDSPNANASVPATGTTSFDTPDQASATVFVRNLNFATTTSRLTEVFKPLPGYLSATVKTRTDPKRPGEILSMGFGFVEFKGKAQAAAAIVAMNGYKLDGHELLVKASTKVFDAAEEMRRADKAKKTERKTKIIIKNLPFEASKKDIRALFGAYGQLRTVRVPKKFDQSTRGFAFADFVTAKEAENAMEALANTHLLGRRLVLDFATGESVDPEEEIQALERKMGQQTDMVNQSKIRGSGRKKFNVDGDDQL